MPILDSFGATSHFKKLLQYGIDIFQRRCIEERCYNPQHSDFPRVLLPQMQFIKHFMIAVKYITSSLCTHFHTSLSSLLMMIRDLAFNDTW